MPLPRRAIQQRARYVRVNNNTPERNITINDPDGFPSAFPPFKPPPGSSTPVTWWWDSDAPTHPVNADNAGLAAVTRCTSLIVNTITSAPWRHYAGSSDPTVAVIEQPTPRWLVDPMLLRPDIRIGESPVSAALRMPRAAFWSQWVRSTLLHGMGYLLFETNADGAPMPGTMHVLNPEYVTPTDEAGYIGRRIGSRTSTSEAALTSREGTLQFGPRTYKLMELQNPLASADEFGITPGVLEMHAIELGLAQRSASYGEGLLGSGIPSGYLQVASSTFSKAQADQLRNDWLEHHGGDRRSTAVLSASVSYTPVQMSPLDAQLIESRSMSLTDIANAFGVPQYMLGAETGGMTYSNAESRSLDFRQYTLLPWAAAVEEVLSSLLPLERWIEIDFRGLLRSDTATRYAAYSTALRDRWMTVDEVRRLEGLPPMEPVDEPFAPTLAPVEYPAGTNQQEDVA